MIATYSQPYNKNRGQFISQRAIAINALKKECYSVIDPPFYLDYWKSETKAELWYLAKFCEVLRECDAVYFCKGWESTKRCVLEHDIAQAYHLTIFYE